MTTASGGWLAVWLAQSGTLGRAEPQCRVQTAERTLCLGRLPLVPSRAQPSHSTKKVVTQHNEPYGTSRRQGDQSKPSTN